MRVGEGERTEPGNQSTCHYHLNVLECSRLDFLVSNIIYILQSKWDAKHSVLRPPDRNGLRQRAVLGQ